MSHLSNDSQFIHSFDDLESITGLKKNFMRRIMNAMPELDGVQAKKMPPQNTWFFTNEGLSMLKYAGIMKKNNDALPVIVAALRESLPPSQTADNRPEQNLINSNQTQSIYGIGDALKAAQDQAKEAFDKLVSSKEETIKAQEATINAQQRNITALEEKLLLLSDGRSPEQIRKEQEDLAAKAKQQEETRATLEKKLEEAHRERQAIEQREKEQAEKAAKELEESKNREAAATAKAERAEKRATLIEQLHTTPWHAFKRKKELQSQIDAIEL